MIRPTSKKEKEPPKEANHKGNIKFPNPLLLQEAHQIMKGAGSSRRRSLEEPSPTARARLKIEIVCAHYNITDTL
jgi:hypothetical protein